MYFQAASNCQLQIKVASLQALLCMIYNVHLWFINNSLIYFSRLLKKVRIISRLSVILKMYLQTLRSD